MSSNRGSLGNMPNEILKEIVEAVARTSVTNRGAHNEICSLTRVNKRFYALAIPHVFRVIDAQEWWHWSSTLPFTSMAPAALQHTRYLSIGCTEESRLLRLGFHHVIRDYTAIATQFITILAAAENVRVVTIHAPQDVIDSFETQTEMLDLKFPSVVELQYKGNLLGVNDLHLSPKIPALFTNLTTLIALVEQGCSGWSERAVGPFLSEVFKHHQTQAIKHLQVDRVFCAGNLSWLAKLGCRVETLVLPTDDYYNAAPCAYMYGRIPLVVKALNELQDLKNVAIPYTRHDFEGVRHGVYGPMSILLRTIYDECPHIQMVSLEFGWKRELRRRSTLFEEGELVWERISSAGSGHARERSMRWTRYLEPLIPHQKVKFTNGAISVVGLNPLLETHALGD